MMDYLAVDDGTVFKTLAEILNTVFKKTTKEGGGWIRPDTNAAWLNIPDPDERGFIPKSPSPNPALPPPPWKRNTPYSCEKKHPPETTAMCFTASSAAPHPPKTPIQPGSAA